MRLIIILASACAVPAVAAPPPKAPPVSINIKTGNAALLNSATGLPRGCADRRTERRGIEDLPVHSCAQMQRDHEATLRDCSLKEDLVILPVYERARSRNRRNAFPDLFGYAVGLSAPELRLPAEAGRRNCAPRPGRWAIV
jgi:hypothetical protein